MLPPEWRRRTLQAPSCYRKLHSSNAAMDNSRAATRVHGGYGFTINSQSAGFYRDAKILEIGEGTSEVQRMLISRDLGLPQR